MPSAKKSPSKISPVTSEPKATVEFVPQAPPPHSNIEVFPSLEERIRQRAYELYEQRGRQDGFAEQDWLRAEAELKQPQRRSA